MKTLIILLLILPVTIYSQRGSINNTLGSGGSFNINDGSANFFSLYQKDGSITLNKINILKGADRFIHDYQAPWTDGYNIFLGLNSGNFSMSGATDPLFASYNNAAGYFSMLSLTEGSSNSAFGYSSLYSTITGSYNSAFGFNSLYSNTTGSFNSAFGPLSLVLNTTGTFNSAFGNYSLNLNTTGSNNTAFGKASLYSNTTSSNNSAFGESSLQNTINGFNNSSFGFRSLYFNSTSDNNSAFGSFSLHNNTYGNYNSAFGDSSMLNNRTGYDNAAFGAFSLRNNTTGYGNTAYGSYSLFMDTISIFNTAIGIWSLYAQVEIYDHYSGNSEYYIRAGSYNTAIGCYTGYHFFGSIYRPHEIPFNTISIGAGADNWSNGNRIEIWTLDNNNIGITYAGIQVPWTITSDRRWKKDIKPLTPGLDFISKLNPVSYTRKNDENKKFEYGFIAQEVDDVLKIYKAGNSGMITKDDNGYYHLRYNDLIAPIVKALQELKRKNDQLRAANKELKREIAANRLSRKEIREVIQAALIKVIRNEHLYPRENSSEFSFNIDTIISAD